ncbi:hypothetical protein BDV26DRAFT_267377 [Aspergillus bertholletiae]|uniref:Uncharacterized protein n=1 Tax=Aspergillus bertholletiae TaxID=1226010 RepID=A0A5N7B0Q5_9EURO|nr:hypothetical protein BDV26DRAFT_267377 [Aspergillus bertholletiae]
MPQSPKRIVLEKSRTVRRRYQRSNKRLKFTASQIARIERDEERERKAQKLREREKKRIADKKKKAEKELRVREERRRLGVPDPDAPTVPSSQPSLFNFLKKGPSVPVEQETTCEDTEPDPTSTEVDTSEDSNSENDKLDGGEPVSLEVSIDSVSGAIATKAVNCEEGDDDEFSDCSIFYDEDAIKEAETLAASRGTIQTEPEEKVHKDQAAPPVPISLPAAESFRDDTAILLEEFADELDTDEEFEQELLRLGAG